LSGHRLLHSFPTRRSSDLIGAKAIATACEAAVPVNMVKTLRANALRCNWPIADFKKAEMTFTDYGQLREALLDPANLMTTIYPLDRKSTRLNSSHVKISYA